ncbi:DUF192 domain-containing protein [Rossellomorea aquimaris]|uniref:DUF192 domain-containing protein n=1 Tax=Rossellomorea aquimaris TaxID=189382 RepID=A0A1J6VZG8_9BACI|nr:DUF192 domain-containing protein [Rossellomorea aquimaris]OIU69748.1 hypothetical protein BHE18_02195 [Rossellomorea aquimaris]
MPLPKEDTLYRTLPYSIIVADTFAARFKGLMFRKDPIVNECLLIAPCNSIHMFFMNFSIDAVFLDEQHRIIKLARDLQPWSIVKPVKEARSVLELPPGSIVKLDLMIQQVIELP